MQQDHRVSPLNDVALAARDCDSTILIVDDSRTQLELLRYCLEQNGYRVTTAANGAEAVSEARREKPALIISDIVMPVMDGYAMCSTIKSDCDLQEIPVMLLTSLASAEDVIHGLNARADYYITKPFDENYLSSRVRHILQPHPRPAERLVDSCDNAGAHNSEARSSEAHNAQSGDSLQVFLDGKSYVVHAERRQMLNLLLSTYENAVQRNNELVRTQMELRLLNEQLGAQQKSLQEANARLETLATVDGLTGLKNHRTFQEELEREYQKCRRYGPELSLLLLDVDHFKQYNDTYGHPAGDEVLKQVAQYIACEARSTDLAARYGGEEFAVVLSSTGAAGAAIFGERLRTAIMNAPWPQRTITASIGIATFDTSMTSRSTLVAQADSALYHSKRSGRNRVTLAPALP